MGLVEMVQEGPAVREAQAVEEGVVIFMSMTKDIHQTMAAFRIQRIFLGAWRWTQLEILWMDMATIRGLEAIGLSQGMACRLGYSLLLTF